MPGKTIEERIQDYDKKIKQIEAQKQLLMNRTKEKERKERTHRLIQLGAKMELAGITTLKQGDAFLKALEEPKARAWLDKIIRESADPDGAELEKK
jgi:hypothetical protein